MFAELEVHPDHLKTISGMLVNALQRGPGEVLSWYSEYELGPLVHLVSANGRARSDSLALIRDVLEVSLRAFEKNPPRFNKSFTVQIASSEIRLDWGLDYYPSKHGNREVDRSTRESWKSKLFNSEPVLLEVGQRIQAIAGGDDGSWVEDRSYWSLDEERFWMVSHLDQWLIDRGRAALVGHLEGSDDRPDLLRSLVCASLASRLSEYFSGTETEAVNHYRHLHHAVLPAWFHHILLHGPPPDITGADRPRGGSFARVTQAAVAMLAPLITSSLDTRQSLLGEYQHMRAARATRSLWPVLGSGAATAHSGGLTLSFADFSGVDRLVSSEGLRFLLARTPAASTDLGGVEPTDGPGFLRLAWAIRNESDPELKRRYITRYVAGRERTMPRERDSAALDQADHLVSWDTVTAELPSLGIRLALAMERYRTAGISGYRTHRYRSLGILANKHNHPAMADHLLNLGGVELASLSDLGEIERLESAQQLHLAKAGVWVKQVEAYLREVPHEAGYVQQAECAAHEAAAFAGSSHRLLLQLAPELPCDPVTGRREHGRIASITWNIQTRIIRLRVGLAVHTALRSGLCNWRILGDLDDAERRLVTDQSELALAWRELIGRSELSAAHQLDLCRIGLWLAFLCDLNLPLTMQTAKAFTALEFFDGDPEAIESGQDERRVDPYEASMWLRNNRADAGWLSWAKPNRPENLPWIVAAGAFTTIG